uniref:Uncharacterized protein n=1 Tax=Oryza brachyantha TaxID=4533 RepID=J3LR31_ORYBR
MIQYTKQCFFLTFVKANLLIIVRTILRGTTVAVQDDLRAPINEFLTPFLFICNIWPMLDVASCKPKLLCSSSALLQMLHLNSKFHSAAVCMYLCIHDCN